ncbi:hypothetical protein AB6O49_15870 [Streptomyces sp. SBR177]
MSKRLLQTALAVAATVATAVVALPRPRKPPSAPTSSCPRRAGRR